MLGLISQWVPHYLASDITQKNSISLDSIWQAIRKYYGFQQSETQFMKFTSITWEDGERPERLYQRILAHLQDNLLRKDSKLKHDGVTPTHDEDISPTVERLAVLRWMELIHPSLPVLVQRTFAFDLQRMTLKDIQPQIVDALDGFLEEIRSEEVKSARVHTSPVRGDLDLEIHNDINDNMYPKQTSNGQSLSLLRNVAFARVRVVHMLDIQSQIVIMFPVQRNATCFVHSVWKLILILLITMVI